jgi:uncharacterized membrane protein YgcG
MNEEGTMVNTNIITKFIISFFFIVFLGGCSSLPQFTSDRCAGKMNIVGDLHEWRNVSAYVDKNNLVAVSMCRDDEFVYVCLTTDDPLTQRQIMGGGLTVWFDPSGSDDKTFGINFPLPRNGPGPRRSFDNETKKDANGNQLTIDQSLFDMEVVGPKETDRYRLSVINKEGILAHLERSKDGLMIYELQVPLKKSSSRPNAIEPKKDFVGLGFETGPVQGGAERPRAEQGGRSGGYGGGDSAPGGGMGSGRRGSGGGRGRGQGGSSSGSAKPPEPVKLWWKVKL